MARADSFHTVALFLVLVKGPKSTINNTCCAELSPVFVSVAEC